jgi:hypothetical protein
VKVRFWFASLNLWGCLREVRKSGEDGGGSSGCGRGHYILSRGRVNELRLARSVTSVVGRTFSVRE